MDYFEEPPWYTKLLTCISWFILSIITAAGLSKFDLVGCFVGFISVWFLKRCINETSFNIFLVITVCGVQLCAAAIFGMGDNLMAEGFILSNSILIALVIYPLMQKNKKLRSDLEEEIYYSEFEWYRKARHERHQKEYEAILKKQK
jgi:hypothetical protein